MVLTAVNLSPEGEPIRWRIENSWSAERGDHGYFIASDKWMDEFCYQVVIDPSVVGDEVLEVLEQKPKILPLWDPMGRVRHAMLADEFWADDNDTERLHEFPALTPDLLPQLLGQYNQASSQQAIGQSQGVISSATTWVRQRAPGPRVIKLQLGGYHSSTSVHLPHDSRIPVEGSGDCNCHSCCHMCRPNAIPDSREHQTWLRGMNARHAATRKIAVNLGRR